MVKKIFNFNEVKQKRGNLNVDIEELRRNIH